MKAADFKPPALASEPFTLPDGTEVKVRALRLTERLAVRRQASDTKATEDTLLLMVPKLLAMSVVDEDGKPLMSADQWDDYGSAHPRTAFDLFNKASELSGFSSEGAEKNS